MKNLILTCIAAVFVLASCKKNDGAISAKSIAGTWVSTENKITGCTENTSNGIFPFDCPTSCRTYEFAIDTIRIEENGVEQTLINQVYSQSFTSNGSTVNESGTFSLSSGLIRLCTENENEEEICRNVNISLNGDILYVFSTDDDSGCEEQTTYSRQ